MKVTYKTVKTLESKIDARDLRNEYIDKLDALLGGSGQTFALVTAPLDVRAKAAREVLGA